MTVPQSLPPSAFRRNVKPPALLNRKITARTNTAKLSNRTARRALLMQIAPLIVEQGRAFTVEMAGLGLKQFQSKGEFQPTDEVATVVDGRLNKPVRNVRFGGNITYLENPDSLRAVAEATAFVFNHAFQSARLFKITGRHMSGFAVLVDGREIKPSEILPYGERSDWQRMTVTNVIPYASKLEAEYQNQLLIGAYKKARADGWTRRVSMKYQIGAQTYAAVDGGRIRRPEIVIQRLGEFVSRGPNRGRL